MSSMLRRIAPIAPMLAAACADGAGAHRVAFYFLLLAIPAGAVLGLDRFADALDGRGEARQAVVSGAALVLLVLGEAVRSPHLAENVAPTLALTSLGVALALLGVQALRGLASAPLSAARRAA
jgi:hypothetical protein